MGKQLSEHTFRIPESDVVHGLGPSYTAGKFECHREHDGEDGVMRIYLQVPHLRTEFRTPDRRPEQAVASPGHAEINGLKQLDRMGSTVAPKLLALRQDKQSDTGIVPRGYIDYLVWAKVPGESMDMKRFWGLQEESRTAIRLVFKALFSELLSIDIKPFPESPDKIIYDFESETMHLEGLRAATQKGTSQQWVDRFYVI
ncbi:hypothetical protein N7463_001695 [Penicillium fimorum]|uniref:Uncharacterized protein n=1 Tax=Penicillium fimorum TaxID=1882269 RepID=A0A9W9XXY5_9EURO|nr:hypothetical protein N7463_001695 [Penicillium fimorum]